MQVLKMNKYRLLNISNTLAELLMFMSNHSYLDRVKDVQKICALRAKDENVSEMEALSLMMKEITITRLMACVFIFSALGMTIYVASLGMDLLAIILGIMPSSVVILGIILRKKMVKKFNDEKISFYTY